MTITRLDENRLALQSSVTRRALFGGIALVLIVSFLVGMDWDEGIADGMVAGTIFYFVITAICLAVAGWSTTLVLDRDAGEARFIRTLFGLRLRGSSLRLSNVDAVVIRGIRFLKEGERPGSGEFSTRIQSYMERRNVYYKLHLETAGQLHLVEDSTDVSDLEAVAQSMAEFLGVTYRREEL